MKFLSLFVLLAVFALVSFADEAPAAEASSDVITLTTADFDEKTKEGLWIIEFYAPWCGHCKKLAPTWEELATKSKSSFNVAKVDCTVEKDVCSKFGVRGYPTVKVFNQGTPTDFKGARTLDAFTTFVEDIKNGKVAEAPATPPPEKKAEEKPAEKKATPPAAEEGPTDVVILDDGNFADKIAEGTWLVKFYAPWCGHCKKLAPTWDELATKSKSKFHVGKIDCTIHKDTCTKFAIRGYPTIKYFHNGTPTDYAGGRTIDEFTKFVEQQTPQPVKKEEL